MGFGLCNALAMFQRMMNELLWDLLDQGVVVYLDDILIFTKTRDEHIRLVEEVLRRLEANDLFCKPEKCFFLKKEVEYLGFQIRHGQIKMNEGKVKAVLEWPEPGTVKALQAFLGFANFYRRFIENYSELVAVLTKLTRKNQKYQWKEEQQAGMQQLKNAFKTAPVLAFPNLEKPFIIECDTSDFATGAILSQRGEDGRIRPVAFHSAAMKPAERNYQVYDKELLAVI